MEMMATTEARYNSFFATEEDARWFNALYSLARSGELRPFPGDHPAPQPWAKGKGRDLFHILRQVDLAEYASRFTQLRRVGPGTWKGLCPLHEERNSSFQVYAEPWRWRCYGACATGGDIVALARELKLKGEVP